MNLRVINGGDEDDSMAANPEDTRADLGFDGPRRRRSPGAPTVWAFVERDGNPTEHGGPVGGGPHVCATCGESTPVLHAIGADPRRRFCGDCQGKANRDRVAWAKAAEPKEDR